jgi:hypothetical protein
MKTNLFRILALVAVSTILLSSCKKKKEEEGTPSDGTTTESNDAQNQWDNALKISEDALDQNDQFSATPRLSGGDARSSATGILGCSQSVLQENITGDGDFIGKITVDFGSSLTNACTDGKVRRGKLIIKYTGRYRNMNTVVQVTTEDYYVNNVKVEGRRTVTNAGNYVYNVVDSGVNGTGYAKFTTLDGKITTWKSTRTRTWTEGKSTALLTDDVYVVSGNADGLSSAGDAYTMTITDLKVKLLCYSAFIYMPVSGTISITSPTGTRSVDYGTGECDRNVTYVHTNGKSYNITL